MHFRWCGNIFKKREKKRVSKIEETSFMGCNSLATIIKSSWVMKLKVYKL